MVTLFQEFQLKWHIKLISEASIEPSTEVNPIERCIQKVNPKWSEVNLFFPHQMWITSVNTLTSVGVGTGRIGSGGPNTCVGCP